MVCGGASNLALYGLCFLSRSVASMFLCHVGLVYQRNVCFWESCPKVQRLFPLFELVRLAENKRLKVLLADLCERKILLAD
jgi:hypothetical protein